MTYEVRFSIYELDKQGKPIYSKKMFEKVHATYESKEKALMIAKERNMECYEDGKRIW